ncbi:cytosol aminopeptidase family, catalytic domain protein [Ostertagia ostertagi]
MHEIFRALSAGFKSPLLVTVPHPNYPHAELVSALGALLPLYTPLNVREEEEPNKFERLGLLPIGSENLVKLVEAFEASFTVCRDVGETGPERMSPPKVADYIKSVFDSGDITVEITDNQDVIKKEYPMMAAVNRAANTVKDHQVRKFLRATEVVGYMCMVRNSIGSHGYTTDEVLTARSGKRIHIYNTDAEGRITMLDPLTKAKEEDFDFHKAECEQAHIRQTGLKPSAQTLRGHQCPGAFMIMASRLDEHGCDSDHPLKFTHIDMGSAAGEHPETSFPNPLVTLVADLILPKHQ